MVAEGFSNRFLNKAVAVIDLNNLYIGRSNGTRPAGMLHSDYKIRLKMVPIGENQSVILSGVPENMIVHVSNATGFPEGVDIILPYLTDSLGFQLFDRYPLVKLAAAERRITELELDMSALILKTRGFTTIAQYRETFQEFMNLFESFKTSVSQQPELSTTTTFPPAPLVRQ